MPKPFNGVVDLDIRESVPDWTPYVADKAPEGAPNVLIVLYDDTGQAAWQPYKILADVELEAGAEGAIMAHGSRFGGHALIVQNGRLHYVYNFIGIPPEQHFESATLEPGRHVLGVEFAKERRGEHGESHGTLRLYVDEDVVAEGPLRTQSGHFSLCGEGLCIGRDSGDAVSSRYQAQFPFTGGTIRKVVFDVGEDAYVDRERHLQAALARD